MEDAIRIIKEYNATSEDAAKDVDAPLNLVLETLDLQKSVAVKA